jgi:hypothetical protein
MNRPALSVVTTDSLSAVDSEVIPCTPARSALTVGFASGCKQRRQRLLDPSHQPFELLLVPGGELRIGGKVVLKQQVPQARLFVCEGEVGVRQSGGRVAGRALLQHGAQMLVEGIEHPCLDVQHHIVEIVEHVVDGAGRVGDAARDLAGGKAGQPLGVDNVLRRIEDQLA